MEKPFLIQFLNMNTKSVRLIVLILFSFISLNQTWAQKESYRAEIRKLRTDDTLPMFTIDLTTEKKDSELSIVAEFKNQKKEIQIKESARIFYDSAEIIEYEVDQRQTKEKGWVKVENNKINIRYLKQGEPEKTKTIEKPKLLVAPANFERWLEVNFVQIKKQGSMKIDFLVWDRMETIPFKVTYTGTETIRGQKAESFKLNVDNFIIAAILNPIRIWKSADMTKTLKYKGRVAVKQVQGLDIHSLDAEVMYFHDLKAAQ